MKWIAGTTTDTQRRVKWNKWFSSLRQQFTRTRLPLNAIPLACTASIGYFSPTHFTLLALSSCCFPQISVLLEVGNPRKSFYPIRGRLMQMSRNNILAPRLLRKLHWFKTHYPKSRVTNSDNTLLLFVSESKTILTLPFGEETIILWMSLDGIARSSRFAANYWLPLIDPFSTDRTSDTKSKEREIRRSKFETYENLHVHVTSSNRDKRRTALRFVISLPFPREKCNARSLFKERERNKKTAAKSSKRYNVPYVKCCPSIAALWIFHLCGTSCIRERNDNLIPLVSLQPPFCGGMAAVGLADVSGPVIAGSGPRSSYFHLRLTKQVFLVRCWPRREIRDVYVRFRSFQDPFDRGPCCWSLVGCFFGRREIYEI